MLTVANMVIPGYMVRDRPLSSSSLLMDAAGEMVAFMVQAPKTGSIRKVGIKIGGVTTATDTDVRIETVDAATGNPSGTLWAANTNVTLASASITGLAFVTTGAFTADASVTKGDWLAVVIAPTGTPNYNIRVVSNGVGEDAMSITPYVKHKTAGTWASVATQLVPTCTLEYSDGTYAPMENVIPYSANTSTAFNSGSTPDERALRWSLPFVHRVSGCWAELSIGGNFDIVFYDSDGTTALTTLSVDGDYDPGLTGVAFYTFASSIECKSNTAYRLSLKPTSASNITAYQNGMSTNAQLGQFGGGTEFYLSTRTDAGAWTDTNTAKPYMGLIIDGIGANALPLIGKGLIR